LSIIELYVSGDMKLLYTVIVDKLFEDKNKIIRWLTKKKTQLWAIDFSYVCWSKILLHIQEIVLVR